jgi:hypothetical protein
VWGLGLTAVRDPPPAWHGWFHLPRLHGVFHVGAVQCLQGGPTPLAGLQAATETNQPLFPLAMCRPGWLAGWLADSNSRPGGGEAGVVAQARQGLQGTTAAKGSCGLSTCTEKRRVECNTGQNQEAMHSAKLESFVKSFSAC